MDGKTKQLNQWLKYGYIGLMAVCLLWYLYSLATFSSVYQKRVWVWVTRCLATGLAVYLGKLWKDKGFLALAAFMLLIFLRALIPTNTLADHDVQESLFLAVWLFGACYGLARVLSLKELKCFITVLTVIWTVCMTVYSAIGIYAAWTDQAVYAIGGRSRWFISEGRLNLIFYYNSAASLLCTSALILTCAILNLKRKWLLIPAILALVIMLIAIALTDSRTEKISYSLGLGGMSALAILYGLRKRNTGRKWTNAVICGGCFLVITAAMVLVFSRITPLFNHLKVNGASPIATAHAESLQAGTTMIKLRGLDDGGSLLNGREAIWQGIFDYLKQNPMILLYGTSIFNPMSGPNEGLLPSRGQTYPHAHNTLIQVLLESGIPGLLLICAFLAVLVICGIRLMRNKNKQPEWIRLLPAAVFALCIGEMVECFIVLLRPYTPQQALVFIGMGIICAYGRKELAEKQAD